MESGQHVFYYLHVKNSEKVLFGIKLKLFIEAVLDVFYMNS